MCSVLIARVWSWKRWELLEKPSWCAQNIRNAATRFFFFLLLLFFFLLGVTAGGQENVKGTKRYEVKCKEKRVEGVARIREKTNAICDKCNNTEAYFEQMQTRSGDEGSTQFYTCTNVKCGFKWKIN